MVLARHCRNPILPVVVLVLVIETGRSRTNMEIEDKEEDARQALAT
jgi:hypothetical protein